ncbi:hypothetical protein ATCC90586_012226 [Pythium insidiosum]|nr:hypothetical protein ATCC90586_012226 [Pythium insidiosum]
MIKGVKHKVLRPAFRKPNKYENRMRRWTIAIFEAARISGYTNVAAREQMETMLCVFAKECHDAVEDLSEEFREQFHVTGPPRCLAIVDECKSDTAFAKALALEADTFMATQR